MTQDGGPAFPVVFENSRSTYGMSLRDYFAGQVATGLALAASIANGQFLSRDEIAAAAYNVADSMLAEREKK